MQKAIADSVPRAFRAFEQLRSRSCAGKPRCFLRRSRVLCAILFPETSAFDTSFINTVAENHMMDFQEKREYELNSSNSSLEHLSFEFPPRSTESRRMSIHACQRAVGEKVAERGDLEVQNSSYH